MIQLFHQTTFDCSRLITEAYSTSFSLGIRTLHKRFREPIYAIYGYVRYADEIVDTFHDHDKKQLLSDFRADTWKALECGISLNPVLHAFQIVVRKYAIEKELIEAFLDSMEMDLMQISYNDARYNKYIYGSAEVVGLMCLRVFCEGDLDLFDRLSDGARKLGAAFQKVNFLRDMQSDFEERGRVYFPGVDFSCFSNLSKCKIEEDIRKDFEEAYKAILQLPVGAKMGVYLSYLYYTSLFKRIQKLHPSEILKTRVRVPDQVKIFLLISTLIRYNLRISLR